MSNDFRPAQNYHYPGAALFTALCGHVNDPADPATGLTTRQASITCEECRRLMPPTPEYRLNALAKGRDVFALKRQRAKEATR